jgi:hypothetical protein
VVSRWVHSRYQRKLADTASGGQEVLIHLQVRRFFCGAGRPVAGRLRLEATVAHQFQSQETSTVTDIARRNADRLRVMNAIFEAAEGSRMSHVSGDWLLEHLEMSDEDLGSICRYLEAEQLITAGPEYWGHHTPFMVLLTYAGIEEMKRSREVPDQATEHFPPISVIHIEGDAIGSAIQAGNPRACRPAPTGDLNLDTVRAIAGQFEARAASLRLADHDARQLRAHMAAVNVQIGLPTPDHYAIREHLQPARAILEHATGGEATAALLDLLRTLHL